MYKVIESKNYRGEIIYQLLCDGEYINTHISAKNIEKFKSKGIDFKDSDAIALYISIYNLQNRAKKKIKKVNIMITIKSSEVLRYLELKSKGYKTLWVGNGLICLVP